MIKISKSDLSWSFFAEFLQFGINLILLPLILKLLTPNLVGLWFVYLGLTRFSNLLDFGFQGNIMRNVTYIFNGATNIRKNGIEQIETSDFVDNNLLKSLIFSIKRIYLVISIIALLILSTLGTIYIMNITKMGFVKNDVIFSWVVVIISITFSIYSLYYTPLLLGRGLVKENKKAIVIANFIYVFFAFFALIFGFGLVGLSIAFLAQVLVQRMLSRHYFYDRALTRNLSFAKTNMARSEGFRLLWPNSWKMGLVSLGAFLTLQANILILPHYVSLGEVAKYGLTLQVFNLLYRVALTYFNTIMPQVVSARMKKDNTATTELMGTSLIIFIFLFFIGSFILIFCGNELILMMGSRTGLLSQSRLLFVAVTLLLEANHSVAAMIISAKNEVPFYGSALFSGFFVVLLSLLLLEYTSFGILSVLLSQFLIQLVYNNWKWPVVIMADLKTNYLMMFKLGVLNIKSKFKF
jgi:O-antigen/teichoic acid export membrane protein